MSRAVVVLAIESGIPVSQWWAEDNRDLVTALDILHQERTEQARQKRDDDGRVTSG